jgi:hypothetical protein
MRNRDNTPHHAYASERWYGPQDTVHAWYWRGNKTTPVNLQLLFINHLFSQEMNELERLMWLLAKRKR